MLSIEFFYYYAECHYAECCYAECLLCFLKKHDKCEALKVAGPLWVLMAADFCHTFALLTLPSICD